MPLPNNRLVFSPARPYMTLQTSDSLGLAPRGTASRAKGGQLSLWNNHSLREGRSALYLLRQAPTIDQPYRAALYSPERELRLLEPLPLMEGAHGLLRGSDEVLLFDSVTAHLEKNKQTSKRQTRKKREDRDRSIENTKKKHPALEKITRHPLCSGNSQKKKTNG